MCWTPCHTCRMLLLLKWSSILLLYAVLASLMPLLRLALAVLYCASSPDLKAPLLSFNSTLTSFVIQGFWLGYTRMRLSTPTHTHTHTHTHHTVSHTHTRTNQSLTQTHTHTYAATILSFSLTHSLTHSLSHTHTHTHIL